jgi:16S rRNA (uracil1498-N3)-methyltransferase
MARQPRIYVPARIGPGPLRLDKDQSRRLTSVMRLRPGDPFLVFGGDGHEWHATLTGNLKAQVEAQVGELVRHAPVPALTLDLWCGLVRANRFDWAVEKCTEAGADIIRPLVSEHAARGEDASTTRLERWQRIAAEAAEQSGRLFVPVIEPPSPFARLIDSPGRVLVLADAGGQRWEETRRLLPDRGTVAIAIGPEGGFSDDEVAAARAHGALVTRLGPNILRTETAAVVATALLRAAGGGTLDP